MPDPGGGDSAATGQGGCGRAIFELTLEHGVWPTRHGEPAREDHDRRSSGVHGDCIDARTAGVHRYALRVGIPTRGTRGKPKPNTRSAVCATGTTAGTCDITGSAGGVTCGVTCW